jgi:hypothetical protein
MTRFAALLSLACVLAASGADARPRHISKGVIVCDQQGCRPSAGAQVLSTKRHEPDATVIGGRPAGCPHRFCGCEASLYLFGKIIPELNLAWNWARKFPRAAPAPRMAAARRGHVMVLISHVSGNDWLVHDGNSGGGKTRRHVRSIKGYVIVDPSGSRVAMQ